MQLNEIKKILKGLNSLKRIKLFLKNRGSHVSIWIYENGTRKPLKLPFLTLSDQSIKADETLLLKKAMQMRDEMEANGGGILAVPAKKFKASECMEEWVNSFTVPAVVCNSRQAMKNFINACGDIPMDGINRASIVKMMDCMKQKRHSPNYVRDIASKIRAFCNWAEQRGYMGRIDTRRLLPPQTFGEVKILTEAEITRLANAPCEECPDVKDLFLMGIYTAQRIGEIRLYTFALRKDGQIRARQGKTGKFIAIPLSQGAMAIVERLAARRAAEGKETGESDRMFVIPSPKVVRRVFKKWLKSAGISDGKVTLRNCRSTAISLLINKGVPEAVTQELANHSDVRTTARYYRQIDDSRKKEALAKIPVFESL